MALNRITLMGRLTRDPEVRHTQSGMAVAGFTLAVDRDAKDKETGEKKTDFIDCVAWGGSAEFVGRHLAKGRQIAVDGRLQLRDWTDKEGNKRRSAEVVVSSVYFAEKGNAEGKEGGNNVQQRRDPWGGQQSRQFVALDDNDSDLPF